MKIFILLFSILCLYLAIYIFHLTYKAKNKSEENLYLNSSTGNHNWILELLHFIVEKMIFFRVDAYKNYPRGNFIFLRSFLQVTAIYILISFIVYCGYGLNTDDLLCALNSSFNINSIFTLTASYFALIFTFYWHEKNKYKDKWNYLANLYNEIIKNYKTKAHNNLMSNSLAIDAVVLMMWNHRSFKNIVIKELRDAVLNLENEDEKNELTYKMKSGLLTEDEAVRILEKRQIKLLEIRTSEMEEKNPSPLGG